MNVKWMAFFIFVWFFGMILGATYDKQYIDTYYARETILEGESTPMTAQSTLSYLFDFSGTSAEGDEGSIFFKLTDMDYWGTWFSVFTLDFNFLKNVNTETGGTSETIISYLFKAIGIVGILCVAVLFIDVIQGFIPG